MYGSSLNSNTSPQAKICTSPEAHQDSQISSKIVILVLGGVWDGSCGDGGTCNDGGGIGQLAW